MPDQHAIAIDAELSAAQDYHQYAIASRLEIRQLLDAIARQSALITASVGGDDFFLTSIVAVDATADFLLLECGRQSEQAQRVLKKRRLLCSTSLDKIKIQFFCEHIEPAVFQGRDAFKAALPQELMRLQRREYFRAATPLATPVRCTISARPDDAASAVTLSLLDISCGGIAVLTPPALFAPDLGMQYACAIHLTGTAPLHTQVEARNAFVVKLANGKTTQRSGFAFVDLTESKLATVQRYIMGLERARRSRATRDA